MVDCRPWLLMCRCTIVVFLYFLICLLISFSVSLGHIFRNPCLMALMILSVVGLKSSACSYCASSGFYVCAIMLFIVDAGC